ncbi:MAG: hypothetical protein JEZ11_21405 [Desulfobacterales bacterium]|nr:hypothetical protein [Desulfobacterales bacterium]
MRTYWFSLFYSATLFLSGPAFGLSDTFKDNIYNPGNLKPIDSTVRVKVGDRAPDFTLPAVSGEKISLR